MKQQFLKHWLSGNEEQSHLRDRKQKWGALRPLQFAEWSFQAEPREGSPGGMQTA